MPPKRIGIIGGMGPLATVDLYRKIVDFTSASRDQEHIPIIIDNYPQIEDRTAFIMGQGENPLEKMCESARRLENANAQAIIIACNTAHYFLDDIQSCINIPIISIVDAVADEIKTISEENTYIAPPRVALLATDGTLKSLLYQERLRDQGFDIVLPNNVQQKRLMDCIYFGAKAGNIAEYQTIFEDTLQQIPAEIYIAACTEIPLFTAELNQQICIIDATFALAKKVVAFAFLDD